MRYLRQSRRRAATAYVEAVLIVPVLLLITAGVYQMHRAQMAKIKAYNDVRQKIWLVSNSGCQDSETTELEDLEDSGNAAEDVKTAKKNIDLGPVEKIPGIGDEIGKVLKEVFGSVVTMSASKTFNPPKVLGMSQTKTMTGNYELACNARRIDVHQMMENFFCCQDALKVFCPSGSCK